MWSRYFWMHVMCTENSSKNYLWSLKHSTTIYKEKGFALVGPYEWGSGYLHHVEINVAGVSSLCFSAAAQIIYDSYRCICIYIESCSLSTTKWSDLIEWAVIHSWSRTLNRTGQTYSAAKRECLVVVRTIQSLRPYIDETSFQFQTGNNVLK